MMQIDTRSSIVVIDGIVDRDVPITGRDFLATQKTLAAAADADISHALTIVGISAEMTKPHWDFLRWPVFTAC